MREGSLSGRASISTTERPAWHDRRRYPWLLGTVVPTLVFAGWGLVNLTGLGLFWWIGPIFVYVLIPVLDRIFGDDPSNPPEDVIAWLERDRYYRYVTYAYLPLQYLALVGGLWLMTRDGGLPVVDRIGLAVTLGCVNGVGINVAHELGHKRVHLERWFSRIALAPSAYGHFFIEHNRGHHVRVATPDDPASSRLGESFWAFWPRTVLGSLRSGWQLETRRLRRMGKPVFGLHNEALTAWAMTALLWAVLAVAFGPGILPYVVLQAVFAFSLLEVVNYLEHYGLLRQSLPNGRYERVTPRHSWNNNHIVTNLFLYQLQRHSDHHANPTRRYQALRHFEESPQLPAGYATMILLAYVPPLWRRVMDRRLLAHYDGDVTRANIQPRRRAAVLARYGVTDNAGAGLGVTPGASLDHEPAPVRPQGVAEAG